MPSSGYTFINSTNKKHFSVKNIGFKNSSMNDWISRV